MSWGSPSRFVNEQFEAFFNKKLVLLHLKGKLFHILDDNHRLETWLPYINQMHLDDETWHVCPTTWVFNAETRNRRRLKTLMIVSICKDLLPSFLKIHNVCVNFYLFFHVLNILYFVCHF
jgi:hypothetical protein